MENKVRDFLNTHADLYKVSALAKKIGCSPSKLSRWLSGKPDVNGTYTKISADKLKQIIRVLKDCAWK